jgi:excisionase family DNA binding protein
MSIMFMDATKAKLLSPAEVATVLGVTRTTVYRKIQAGELRAVRLGEDGPLRVDPDELEAWLSSHATGGDAA